MENNGSLEPNTSEEYLRELMERPGSSLRWAKKLDSRSLEYSEVEDHVYRKGLPLVISNTTRPWQRDRELFSWDWLRKNTGNTIIQPRDVRTGEDLPNWRLSEYVDYLTTPSGEWSAPSAGVPLPPYLYGKDIPCPSAWRDFLTQRLPDFCSKGSNDLMGELLTELQPETLLLYLGREGTLTPGHLDILGSLGHNLMVYADEGASALWLCVSQEDLPAAILFWEQETGGSLLEDNRWISWERLAQAPFPVWVIDQREGDFVLLPSDCAHEVINRGGRSLKVAWNTYHPLILPSAYQQVLSLSSYSQALPRNRSVGKPELYRLKATAYYALLNRLSAASLPKVPDSLVEHLPPLLTVVEDMTWQEWIDLPGQPTVEIQRFTSDDVPHQRTCDFCHCDIWNRCYHCSLCGEKEGYDICIDCVAEGRGCVHKSSLELREYLSASAVKGEVERAQETYERLLRNAKKRRKPRKRPLVEWSGVPNRSQRSPGTIAYLLVKGYKNPPKFPLTCHQCLKEADSSQTICMTCSCGKHFCAKCLWHRYGRTIRKEMSVKKWKCLVCSKECNCGVCLTARGVSDISLEGILGSALSAAYPFQSMAPPNVPAVSDGKPHLHVHALKKRKAFLSPSSTVPSHGKGPTPLPGKKMTERQQIKFLLKDAPRPSLSNSSSSSPSSPQSPPSDSSSVPMETVSRSPEIPSAPVPTEPRESPRKRFKREPSPPVESLKHSQSGSQDLEVKHSESPRKSFPQESSQPSEAPKWIPQEPQLSQKNSPISSPSPSNGTGHWDSSHYSKNDHHSTLLLRNLSPMCREGDLFNFFGTYGKVVDVTIPKDEKGSHRGFGFVRFSERREAEKALEECHLRPLFDRVLELEWSVDKKKSQFPEKRKPWDHTKPRDSGVVCFYCRQEGHIVKFCPNLKNTPSQDYVCFRCGVEGLLSHGNSPAGHVASHCPEKGTYASHGSHGNGHYGNGSHSNSRRCFSCGGENHFQANCPNKPPPPSSHGSQPSHPSHSYSSHPSHSSHGPYPSHSSHGLKAPSPALPPSPQHRPYSPQGYSSHSSQPSYSQPPYPSQPYVQPSYPSHSSHSSYPRSLPSAGVPGPSYSSHSHSSEKFSAPLPSYPNYSPFPPSYHSRDARDPRDLRDSRDVRDPRDVQDPRDIRDPRDVRDARDSRDIRDIRDPRDLRDPRSMDIPRDSRDFPREGELLSLMQMYPGFLGALGNGISPVVPTTPPTTLPAPSPEDTSGPKQFFKQFASKLVVGRLTPHYSQGLFSSKEDFKSLSRKIVSKLVEKERSRQWVVDRETEGKIKKFTESYYLQYSHLIAEKNRGKVEQWLRSV